MVNKPGGRWQGAGVRIRESTKGLPYLTTIKTTLALRGKLALPMVGTRCQPPLVVPEASSDAKPSLSEVSTAVTL